MGRSRVIPFLITFKCQDEQYYSPCEWYAKQRRNYPQHHVDGTPSPENIAVWVAAFEHSRQPGGCNAHCGYSVVTEAQVIDQKRNVVVAHWERPIRQARLWDAHDGY